MDRDRRSPDYRADYSTSEANGIKSHHGRRWYQAGGYSQDVGPVVPYEPPGAPVPYSPYYGAPPARYTEGYYSTVVSEKSYYAQPPEKGNTVVIEKEKPGCTWWCICLAIFLILLLFLIIVVLVVFFCIGGLFKGRSEDIDDGSPSSSSNNQFLSSPTYSDVLSAPLVLNLLSSDRDDICVVDIGTPADFQFQGHLKGAIQAPLPRLTTMGTSYIPEGHFPSANDFEANMRELGLNFTCQIIVYDHGEQPNSAINAAYAWWLFKRYGHTSVSVLEGGYQDWTRRGFANTTLPTPKVKGNFAAKLSEATIISYQELDKLIKGSTNNDTKTYQLIDVRDKPAYVSGHIDDAVNVPVGSLFANSTGTISTDSIVKMLTSAGAREGKLSIIYDQNGYKAPEVYLIMKQLPGGWNQARIYYGGYDEWLANKSSGSGK